LTENLDRFVEFYSRVFGWRSMRCGSTIPTVCAAS
jgi:predicted enzyme related to lactoylglutathione lyase